MVSPDGFAHNGGSPAGSTCATTRIRPPLIRARRWLFFGLVATTTAVAVAMMAHVVGGSDSTVGGALELAIIVLFALNFCWITMAFWTGTVGFCLLAAGRDPLSLLKTPRSAGETPIVTRTALVMPVHNEDPRRVTAGLAATLRSLARTGEGDRFDAFLLSDTTDPDIALEEEATWAELRRDFDGPIRAYYRRRSSNTGRKAGNIQDFCQRWGTRYDFMVVLDADSVMDGTTLVDLVRTMQANPDAALLQTLPTPVRRDTLFGRILQFGRWLYGPILATGISFWQTDSGNYWGHNAIVRVKPFTDHCGLPVLPGRPPRGGEILSHDFVEAALLRRAGWKIYLLPTTGGSYEEVPGNILDYAKRDQRWSQGNLQHLKLLRTPGLHHASRMHFAVGAMGYVASALWMLMLMAGTAYALLPRAGGGPHGAVSMSQRMGWPSWEAGVVVPLLAVVLVVLFLPKFLAMGLALARHPERYGGSGRLIASTLLETIAAIIVTPIMMVYHSHFVLSFLRGRGVGWDPQNRDGRAISWTEAWRQTVAITVIGVGWTGLTLFHEPSLLVWMSPILAGLVFAVPVIRWTSMPSAGRWARRRGLFLVPSELSPPPVLAEAESTTPASPTRFGPLAPWHLPPEQPRAMATQSLGRRP